jgi:hypothetical protein
MSNEIFKCHLCNFWNGKVICGEKYEHTITSDDYICKRCASFVNKEEKNG